MSEPGEAPGSEIVFYQEEDGQSRIQVRLDGGTVWLTQRLLAELYQVSVPTINEHLGNVFDEQELDPAATIRKFRIVQLEGKREVTRLVDHYNLDVILAVGYRVRSHRGTQFRRWATERLREYVVKGFAAETRPTSFRTSRSLKARKASSLARPVAHVERPPALGLLFGVVEIHGDDAVELPDLNLVQIAQKLALDEYEKFERRRLVEEASAADELEEAARRLGPGTPAKRPSR